MKPRVDKDGCIGCGLCASICPEIFLMDEQGKAVVIEGADYDANIQKIKESIEGCPTKAILD